MEGRTRKKKPLSRLAKTFLSYALIAALALPTQASGDEIVIDPSEPQRITIEGDKNIEISGHEVQVGRYVIGVSESPTFTSVSAGGVTMSGTGIAMGGQKITGLAAGDITKADSTDAVTGGQLYSLGDAVARIVGTTIGYDGESFSVAINIGGSDYDTIESALNALYNGIAGSTGGAVGGDEIVIDPSNGAVTIAEGGNIQITQDAADSNKFTVSVSPTPTFTAVYADSASIGGITVGSGGINLDVNGGNKKITGLADGHADTDAVNVRQLNSLGASVKNTLGREVARVIGGGLSYSGDTFSGGVTVGGSTFTTVQEALNALYNNTVGGSGTQDPGGGEIVIDPSDPAKMVTIAEGKNIKISEDADTEGKYIVGVSESPNFTSVSAENATIDGMTFNEGGITMGGKTITGLAGGLVAMDSTEAVTGGQLYGLGASVIDALGGSSKFENGTVTAGIEVGGTTYASVQEALNAVNTGGGTAAGNAVQYDDDSKATVTLKDKDGGAVKLTNLAEGDIKAGSTDAVTGGQLYTTNENIKTVSDSLGESVSKALGGSSKFENGTVTAGIEVGGTTYASVQEALNAVNTGGGTAAANAVQYDDGGKTSVTLNKSGDAVKLTNVADGTDDLDAVNKRQLDGVQEKVDVHETTLEKHETTLNEHTVMIENHEEQFTALQTVLGDTYSSPSFSSITVGNIYSDGTNINMGGGTITGLADGSIAPGSTDAVTGGQLWNAYKRMDDLNESINIVGAHAAALSGLHPIQYNPYEPTTLSAAVGTYRDEYAVAVGVFHYVRSNVLFNLGASICSDGDVMGRAGVSLAVGKGGKKKPELARDMVGMQQQMLAMQAKLETLEEKNKESEAARAKLMEENMRDKEIIKKNADIMAQNEKLIRELMKKLEAK